MLRFRFTESQSVAINRDSKTGRPTEGRPRYGVVKGTCRAGDDQVLRAEGAGGRQLTALPA